MFGSIYGTVSGKLVRNENHRYVSGFENSMINKIYMFQFVNTYIGNFFAIIYTQQLHALTVNVFVIMVVKQVILNVMEYYQDKIEVGDKIKKVEKLFEEPIRQAALVDDDIELADLRMHLKVEKQLRMKPAANSLVPYYNEAVIQMGFVAFFATSFPFAPLFSFLTNLLEIKIKLQYMSAIGRRNIAHNASGIGNWMPIMSFIAYFAIPCNTLILLICRFPSVPVGWNQDLDALELSEKSVLVQYLENKDPNYWNRANIFFFAICIEHLVIGLKIVIALIIPDVPYKVQEDEFKRVKILEKVQKELLEIKIAGNHEDFEDMTNRLQREASKLIEADMKREADEKE